MLVYVAPRVGAWIEISTSPAKYPAIKSLPVWERGLKYVTNRMIERDNGRSPCGSVD